MVSLSLSFPPFLDPFFLPPFFGVSSFFGAVGFFMLNLDNLINETKERNNNFNKEMHDSVQLSHLQMAEQKRNEEYQKKLQLKKEIEEEIQKELALKRKTRRSKEKRRRKSKI